MNAWNDYMGPPVYINQEKLYPLALGIANLQRSINTIGSHVMATRT